jgi:hypothetical protein
MFVQIGAGLCFVRPGEREDSEELEAVAGAHGPGLDDLEVVLTQIDCRLR